MKTLARFRSWLFTPRGALIYFGVCYALVLLFFLVLMPEAKAAYCHAGVYRSGCVSRYGATVRRHGYRGYANRCYWRAGRRICH